MKKDKISPVAANNSSQKNEGRGGRAIFAAKEPPTTSENQWNFSSDFTKIPNREEDPTLILPALANNAIAAHPWAKDNSKTINTVLQLKEASPSIIKVMWVTLL